MDGTKGCVSSTVDDDGS